VRRRIGVRYVVQVIADGKALARHAGLLDRGGRPVRGLSAPVVAGGACDAAAAWRGTFLVQVSLSEPGRLPVLEVGCPALILGPSESVNPHLAAALGHIAIRRRRKSVHVSRADNLFTRLRAALRTTPWPPRCRLARVQVLILDDFALRPLNPTETSDFYELVVERYGKASTILTSNREPAEWMCLMSDALLQSAVDRLSRRPRPAVDGGPRRGGIGQDPQVSVAVFGRPQFVPSQRPGSTRCRGPNLKSPTAAAQHR